MRAAFRNPPVGLTVRGQEEKSKMPTAQRIAVNLLTRDIGRSTEFYRRLCDLEPIHSESWYVVLAMAPESPFHLGLIDWVSEFVPRAARGEAQGSYLEIIVDNVEAALAAISHFNTEIIEEPTVFGQQTRAVMRDIDGHVIDLSTPHSHHIIPPRKAVA